MNVPNMLTLSRIGLIPVFAWVFFSEYPHRMWWALGIYLLAGVTDFLDGYLSRRLNQVTTLGIVLDPLADKVMLVSVLGCLVVQGLVPVWILVVLTLKEMFMVAGGFFLWFKKEKTAVPADWAGKLGTGLLYIALSATLVGVSDTLSLVLMVLAVGVNGMAFCRYAEGFRRITDSTGKH